VGYNARRHTGRKGDFPAEKPSAMLWLRSRLAAAQGPGRRRAPGCPAAGLHRRLRALRGGFAVVPIQPSGKDEVRSGRDLGRALGVQRRGFLAGQGVRGSVCRSRACPGPLAPALGDESPCWCRCPCWLLFHYPLFIHSTFR